MSKSIMTQKEVAKLETILKKIEALQVQTENNDLWSRLHSAKESLLKCY